MPERDTAPEPDGAHAGDPLEASRLETAWAAQVRANRDQVERIREVPDGRDFYAPVTKTFVADPDREPEPALAALLELTRPGDTWLDVGAGAGRYALPLARRVLQVVALDPSVSMLEALEASAAERGIGNVRAVEGRWPVDPATDAATSAALGPLPCADVALIAHVSYDVEAIGPFLDALEAAARRRVVALLMDRQPSSVANPAWPPVHGEARIPLPALHELVPLLRARGRDPEVRMLAREPRLFTDLDDLRRFLRRQLWIADDGPKQVRFKQAVEELAEQDADGSWRLRGQPTPSLGLATWSLARNYPLTRQAPGRILRVRR